MATIEVQRFIGAPPQAVWDVIADIERQATWMVDVRRLRIRGERRSGAGTIVDVTSALFGLPLLHDVMEVTGWEPPRRMAVAHRGAFTGDGEWLLEPQGAGTLVTWIERVRPPLGIAGELAFAAIVRPHLRRVFGRSLANVKRLSEARAAAASA